MQAAKNSRPTLGRRTNLRSLVRGACCAVSAMAAAAVALVMVTKPTSLPIALGIVAVGVVVGVLIAPKRPAAIAAQPAVAPGGD